MGQKNTKKKRGRGNKTSTQTGLSDLANKNLIRILTNQKPVNYPWALLFLYSIKYLTIDFVLNMPADSLSIASIAFQTQNRLALFDLITNEQKHDWWHLQKSSGHILWLSSAGWLTHLAILPIIPSAWSVNLSISPIRFRTFPRWESRGTTGEEQRETARG